MLQAKLGACPYHSIPSGLSHLKSRVQMSESNAGICGCELPNGFAAMLVAIGLPGFNLFGEQLLIRDTAVETLIGQNAQLGLGHVEPASVFWGIMPFEAFNQPPGFFRREYLIQ